jgi:hypothetical protein
MDFLVQYLLPQPALPCSFSVLRQPPFRLREPTQAGRFSQAIKQLHTRNTSTESSKGELSVYPTLASANLPSFLVDPCFLCAKYRKKEGLKQQQ